MADRQEKSVLRRKAEAGRTSAAATRLVTPCKALSTALVKAVDAHVGLEAAVRKCAMRTGTLAEVLETVPDGGLLAVLEGPDEAQGVMAFDAVLLSALIERLMTGALAARPPAPRRATRTDAALVADVIDAMLRRFEAALGAGGAGRWAAGFGYASFIESPRPLALMLEDADYRLLTLEVDLESGARAGSVMLVLPAGGAGGGASRAHGAGTAGAACEQGAEEEG
ncbi:MAG: flagellar motor switch protein FliM, partial [Paracoccaceae bacterium]|nr:flagellar motor switch protein FliM [Paracoccaceae bacterium]